MDNGKENGLYYNRVQGVVGLHRDNGKENGHSNLGFRDP